MLNRQRFIRDDNAARQTALVAVACRRSGGKTRAAARTRALVQGIAAKRLSTQAVIELTILRAAGHTGSCLCKPCVLCRGQLLRAGDWAAIEAIFKGD